MEATPPKWHVGSLDPNHKEYEGMCKTTWSTHIHQKWHQMVGVCILLAETKMIIAECGRRECTDAIIAGTACFARSIRSKITGFEDVSG